MDLNGDGHIDLISGSWPGELFFFKGGPGRTFAAPEMLKDKDGHYINIGGGIREEPDGGILITGNAEFEKTEEGTVAVYHGKRIKSTAEKPVAITGTASAVHAADWDGDGDYDLIVGEIGGSVYLVRNEGTPKEWAFAKEVPLEALGTPLRVEGDAGPFVADWDGDGDIDLLVGAGDGSVSLYRNRGTTRASSSTKAPDRLPVLAAAEELVPKGETSWDATAPKEPRRGVRTKVCAADWNGDGRLDLLLGDFATQKPDLPEPTAEEKAEHDRLRKELDASMKRYRELSERVRGRSRVRDDAEREKARAEMDEVRKTMQDLRKKLPAEYDNHGWIWLFLRKPAESQGRAR